MTVSKSSALLMKKISERYYNDSKELVKSTIENKHSLSIFLNSKFPGYLKNIDHVLKAYNQMAPTPISCSAGCDACCYTYVGISSVEAVYMIHNLNKNYSTDQLIRIHKAIAERQLFQNILKRKESCLSEQVKSYFEKKIPCQFLIDHQCSIYEFRPVACRNLCVVTPNEWCSHSDMYSKIKIFRHPSVYKIDIMVQKFLSDYYLKLRDYDIMQSQLLRFWNVI